MSTRLVVFADTPEGKKPFEYVRDGFNVYYAEPDMYDAFNARRTLDPISHTDVWVYTETVSLKTHRAIFFSEEDVTDYLIFRVKKHYSTLRSS